jgi:Zn-dependent alcohol dehydrogenase
LLPRSRREVYALVCLGQLLWLGAVLAWAGVSAWSVAALIGVGAIGSATILIAGILGARRFRRCRTGDGRVVFREHERHRTHPPRS